MNNFFIRAVLYYKKYGLLKSIHRAWIVAKRSLFQNTSILFFANLIDLMPSSRHYPNLKIESKQREEDISEENYKQLCTGWNNQIIISEIKKFFNKGAVLRLAKLNDEAAGFLWTIRKNTVKPFFFPLLAGDVYLFDNEILEDYRGKGINSVFIDKVLMELKHEGYIRAFIDTKAWNESEIRSLEKTLLNKLAFVRQVHLLGKNIVFWGTFNTYKIPK